MTITPQKWTEAILLAALNVRYAPPQYALLTHVPNAPQGDRTIDAIAMGCWPSRGLDLHGFEIKVDRRDWLREFKSPEKAEGWRFDFFWLVTPLDLVKTTEVPPAWGLIEARETRAGTRLTVTKEAPAQKPKPLTRPILAAIMRKVQKVATSQDDRDAAHNAGFLVGHANAREQLAHENELTTTELRLLREKVDAFEQASGVRLRSFESGQQLGQRVRIAQALDALRVSRGLDTSLHAVTLLLRHIEETRDTIREVMTDATKEPAPQQQAEDDETRASRENGHEGEAGSAAS